MAAVDFDATTIPQDIAAAASLAVGKAYTIGNASTTATLYVRADTSVPPAGARAFRIEAGGAGTTTPRTGEGVYVWTDDVSGCPVIVDDVP